MPKPVHIVGVPLDLGGNRRGVDMGPSAFRIAGLGERLTALGARFVRHHEDARDDYVVMTDPEGNEFCVCAVTGL